MTESFVIGGSLQLLEFCQPITRFAKKGRRINFSSFGTQ